MGILTRLIGRRRGPSTDELIDGEDQSVPDLIPTPSMRPIPAPPPTPSTQPLGGTGPTAGTRTYGTQGGTPSTQRIHNPTRPGR